jgi:uncharacterized membrane protein YhaH (DUF805 family)
LKQINIALIKDLFSFTGRIGRSQWWVNTFVIAPAFLLVFLFLFRLTTPVHRAAEGTAGSAPVFLLLGIVSVVAIFAPIAIIVGSAVRRSRDLGRNPLWMLLHVGSGLGIIWLVVEHGFFPSKQGANPITPSSDELAAKAVQRSAPANHGARARYEPLSGLNTRGQPLSTRDRLAQQAARNNLKT